MLREFAPLITAIIIAGRSGSAYAAQIGTMSVTEEIDALRTLGIAPLDLLVLPKILALVIALPLLTVFADLLGVFGGMLMARAQLGVGFGEFLDRLVKAVSVTVLSGRHLQGAGVRVHHRRGRLLSGFSHPWRRRQRRPPDHAQRRAVDFPGDRRRRPVLGRLQCTGPLRCSSDRQATDVVIELSKVSTRFGEHVVHSQIDLQVRRSEIFALIGGSGSGKSTLLREMILLQRPNSGSSGCSASTWDIGDDAALALRQRWGVMFQHGGLFGSLTVKENVGLPLREHSRLDDA
jgi:ABC-type multidrug transport system fused ATPase/permease subunit